MIAQAKSFIGNSIKHGFDFNFGGLVMNNFDIQRIENANWVLQRYRDELEDTNVDIVIDRVTITPRDALRVLDLALYKLTK